MIDPSTMSNKQIVAAYKRAEDRQSEIRRAMIAEGFGSLELSIMCDDPVVHPLAQEYLALLYECQGLGAEAHRRYGPGLIVIERLVTALWPSYKRIKGEDNA